MNYHSIQQHIYASALHYFDAGLNVVPIRLDGTKAPLVKWKPLTTQRAERLDVQTWFAKPAGIGVICGATSGNLEVIDFDDNKPLPIFWSEVGGELARKLLIVATPDQGCHVYYRCPTIEGNQVLAADREDKTLIETRGQGGLVVVPGSPPNVHRLNKAYRVISGDILHIPTITPDEREVLFRTARMFNLMFKAKKPEYDRTYSRLAMLRQLYGTTADRPGDKFDATTEWDEILEPHGWTVHFVCDGVVYWTRPGKHEGTSATSGYNGTSLLYVFSSNCKPFEPERAYSKFAAYSLLNHSGDFSAAAKQLINAEKNKEQEP